MSSGIISFKIILVGEGNVGKTAIRQNYLGEGFAGKYQMTIGADFAVKRVESDGTMFVIQIWDLAGQSGFLNTRKLYYGGAMAALLVFDLTRIATFEKCDNWIREIQDNRGELIPIILIGNKSDLRDEVEPENQVSVKAAKAYAKELRQRLKLPVTYIETSAKESKNIEFAFETIISHIQKVMNNEEWDLEEDEEEEEEEVSQDEITEHMSSSEEEDELSLSSELESSAQEEIAESTSDQNEVESSEHGKHGKAPVPEISDETEVKSRSGIQVPDNSYQRKEIDEEPKTSEAQTTSEVKETTETEVESRAETSDHLEIFEKEEEVGSEIISDQSTVEESEHDQQEVDQIPDDGSDKLSEQEIHKNLSKRMYNGKSAKFRKQKKDKRRLKGRYGRRRDV